MQTPTEIDENGDSFEVWLVKRSYALLAPICKLGFAIVLLFLCVADPLYYFLNLWSRAVPQGYLVAWHASMALFFGALLMRMPQVHSHAARLHTLLLFSATTALLFVWFGVVSWLGTGDLSMVAMAQMLVAAVLCVRGPFRRWTYGLQALGITLLLAWLDSSGRFLGQMQFANLLVMACVAFVMDGYMFTSAQALFTEKCRVVQERERADAVLYNALPPAIAEELKANQCVQAQNHPAMTILFADVVCFTQFAAERAPQLVVDTLNALFSEIDRLVDVHQVEKIKTIGDSYMVVSPTDPEALAHLALSIRELMLRFNARQEYQMALRLGLHCGPTIAGVIGQKRFLYDVWGDAVNLANRMEASSEPGRIQTSESLFHTLRHAFDFEPRGLVDIKGKGALPTYFLLGAKPLVAHT